MEAGKLDRRIVIERYTEAQDDFGQPIETYEPVDTVWAEVKPLRGQERFQAQQVSAEAETRFRIRWRNDIDEKMVLVHDGAVYDIKAILEIGRREGLEILAKARVPA